MKAVIKLLPFLCLISAANAYAECDPKTGAGCEPSSDFSGLPIDQLPPGARSLGLGGAFTGVADDATAAIANPAGLSILTAKEFSLHVRNTDSDVAFLDPDAFDSSFYTVPGELNKGYSDSATNVSFASFVLPLERWVFSAYYMNQLDFQSGQVGGDDIVYDAERIDTYFNDNAIKSSIDAYGLSAAFRITDSFSVGLTIQQSKLKANSLDSWQINDFKDDEFAFAEVFGNGTPEEYAATIIDEKIVQSNINDSDSATTFSLGLMYNLNSNWSFGLVYRDGSKFDVTTDQLVTVNSGCQGTGATYDDCISVIDDSTTITTNQTNTTIQVPDTTTLGIGWRPTDTLLFAFDVNFIGYSDSTPVRSFTQGFGADVNSGPIQLTEKIDNATTFHFGAEKVFILESNNTISIRGGVFTIEDHDGNATIDSDDTAFTVGVGTTFGSQSQFQLDLGASFADATNNIILSGIYRF
jgi:long-chain fatty acid transport protein